MQFLSGIHLDMRKGQIHVLVKSLIDSSKGSKYLVLLGDIAPAVNPRLESFLIELSSGPWKRIFYVPGNHEYYSTKTTPFYEMENRLLSIASSTRVEILIRKSIELPECTLIGATLWSDLDFTYYAQICYHLNDLWKIYTNKDKQLTFEEYREWHKRDVRWLKQELKTRDGTGLTRDGTGLTRDGKPVIVLTHHAPSLSCVTKNNKLQIISTTASNLDHLCDLADFWLHGSTCNDHCIGKTLIKSNILGYPDEEHDNFDFGCRIELKDLL